MTQWDNFKIYLYYHMSNPFRYIIERSIISLFGWLGGIFGIMIRTIIYRSLFKGKGMIIIEKNVDFQRTNDITINKGAYIGRDSRIYATPGGIMIGKNVKIKEGCYLDVYNFAKYTGNCKFRDGSKPQIQIGDNTIVGPRSIIYGVGGVNIGQNVMIAGKVNIVTLNHFFKDKKSLILDQGIECGRVRIEDNVWIGINSTILAGVRIGRGSVIGANTVVTKDVPNYCVVVGNPGKIIKKY